MTAGELSEGLHPGDHHGGGPGAPAPVSLDERGRARAYRSLVRDVKLALLEFERSGGDAKPAALLRRARRLLKEGKTLRRDSLVPG